LQKLIPTKAVLTSNATNMSKLLCVDDDPIMLKALRLNLHRFFEVETAESARRPAWSRSKPRVLSPSFSRT